MSSHSWLMLASLDLYEPASQLTQLPTLPPPQSLRQEPAGQPVHVLHSALLACVPSSSSNRPIEHASHGVSHLPVLLCCPAGHPQLTAAAHASFQGPEAPTGFVLPAGHETQAPPSEAASQPDRCRPSAHTAQSSQGAS